MSEGDFHCHAPQVGIEGLLFCLMCGGLGLLGGVDYILNRFSSL